MESKEGFVYILQEGYDNSFKIGSTKNDVEFRKQCLQVGNSTTLRVFGKIKTADYEKLENELHDQFNKDRERGEWFYVDPKAIVCLLEEMGGELCVDDPYRVRIAFDKEAFRAEVEKELRDELQLEHAKDMDDLMKKYEVRKKILSGAWRALLIAIKTAFASAVIIVICWFIFMAADKRHEENKKESITKAHKDSLAAKNYDGIENEFYRDAEKRWYEAMNYRDSLRTLKNVSTMDLFLADLDYLAAKYSYDREFSFKYDNPLDKKFNKYEEMLNDSSYCAEQIEVLEELKSNQNGASVFKSFKGKSRLDILYLRSKKLSDSIRVVEVLHPDFWLRSKYHR